MSSTDISANLRFDGVWYGRSAYQRGSLVQYGVDANHLKSLWVCIVNNIPKPSDSKPENAVPSLSNTSWRQLTDVGVSFRGVWRSSLTPGGFMYALNDIVYYQGSAYICQKAGGTLLSVNAPDIDSINWGILASEGEKGDIGKLFFKVEGAFARGTNYCAAKSPNIQASLVTWQGASWYCIANTDGLTYPHADAEHWAPLAPKGDKGDAGRDGTNGIDGKNGEKGEQGDKGDKGDQGPVGITAVERSEFDILKDQMITIMSQLVPGKLPVTESNAGIMGVQVVANTPLVITWPAANDTGLGPITQYVLTGYPSGPISVPATSTTVEIIPLPDTLRENFVVQVAATNRFGTGPSTPIWSFTAPPFPVFQLQRVYVPPKLVRGQLTNVEYTIQEVQGKAGGSVSVLIYLNDEIVSTKTVTLGASQTYTAVHPFVAAGTPAVIFVTLKDAYALTTLVRGDIIEHSATARITVPVEQPLLKCGPIQVIDPSTRQPVTSLAERSQATIACIVEQTTGALNTPVLVQLYLTEIGGTNTNTLVASRNITLNGVSAYSMTPAFTYTMPAYSTNNRYAFGAMIKTSDLSWITPGGDQSNAYNVSLTQASNAGSMTYSDPVGFQASSFAEYSQTSTVIPGQTLVGDVEVTYNVPRISFKIPKPVATLTGPSVVTTVTGAFTLYPDIPLREIGSRLPTPMNGLLHGAAVSVIADPDNPSGSSLVQYDIKGHSWAVPDNPIVTATAYAIDTTHCTPDKFISRLSRYIGTSTSSQTAATTWAYMLTWKKADITFAWGVDNGKGITKIYTFVLTIVRPSVTPWPLNESSVSTTDPTAPFYLGIATDASGKKFMRGIRN